MGTLEAIAQKELAQQPLNASETYFLQGLIENQANPYTGQRNFSGWFPRLHYRNIFDRDFDTGGHGSDKADPLVADVHTDVPAPIVGDPGCVLHEAVGNVNLLIIAVDNGPDRMIYAGPVLSHYEFEVAGVSRESDAEWKTNLAAGKMSPPAWTSGYLVPNRPR